ncbi:RING finger protein 10-like isoform X2 [Limulus polyphemus]|uniref:E3 ubiquitin-protein ligase RNF10 n=1 Tax=Limulus polyphemus TaxID=6850 RepID=A0ABM1B0K2_LIMPO|nr:RING finger protein 10-like isoform X2 [Limulus polyphemus]
MLEEPTMEKKGAGRSASSKSNGSDSKVKQDTTSKFPRSTKQKESSGFRYEPIKKPAPQKSRTTNDKRPRPRGNFNINKNNGLYYNGERSQVVESIGAEIGSAQNPGSKKINLNHLLNFTFTPRESGLGGNLWPKGGAQRQSSLPRYNKEQFLQANYQFVVHENGNYAVHSVDPDILVDWSLVEEVRVPSFEAPCCPICLYPPTAAKITRCGHIYCWSCILHYLSLSDKTWRKCPICYEAVCKDNLKSVDFANKTTKKVGDEINLSLMVRDKESVFAVPVTHWSGVIEKPFHIDDDAAITCFQKLVTACPKQVNTILSREKSEMVAQLTEEKDTPESCFIELALQRGSFVDPFADDDETDDINATGHEDVVEKYARSLEVHEQIKAIAKDVCDFQCFPENKRTETKKPAKKPYYFYQASDGQNIFLHALNVRMLIKEYGSLENCPTTLAAKILELEGFSMDEVARKRLRYLQHLPLTCEFQVVEAELKPPVVSQETVEMFRNEIEKRQCLRNQRAWKEKKRERYLEKEELRKLGKYPDVRYRLDSLHHFPTWIGSENFNLEDPSSADISPAMSEADSISSEMSSMTSLLSPATCDSSQSICSQNSSEDVAVQRTTSFAQMLQDSKSKPDQWSHTVKRPGSEKTSINTNIKETGSTEDIDDDFVPVPQYQQSFSDAFQAALDSISQQSSLQVQEQSGSKKKKKRKKTILIATTMNRGK